MVPAPGWLITAAANAYKEDYPSLGRHSIGWRSVPSQIGWVEAKMYSWAHGRVWASVADQAAAAAWVDTYQRNDYFATDVRAATPAVPLEEVG